MEPLNPFLLSIVCILYELYNLVAAPGQPSEGCLNSSGLETKDTSSELHDTIQDEFKGSN